MKLVVVMDPIERINPSADSSFMLLLEGHRRGYTCYYTLIEDLFVEDSRPVAMARTVVVGRGEPFYEQGEREKLYLDEVDVIFMRKDPPFDRNFIFATYILDLAVGKALVVNDPVGIKLANEKMYALHFPDLTPENTVSNDPEVLKAFMRQHGGEMIIKPWDQAGGGGIFHLKEGDKNLNSLLEMSTQFGKEYVIGQRYLPEVRVGDKRILLFDGEVCGGFLRIPSDDDNRSNMHVGASVKKSELSERDLYICEKLRPALKRDGLLFVGIDVIGDYLTEINVTSPTGIQELNTLDGIEAEKTLMDCVESYLNRGVRRLGTAWNGEKT